VIFSGAAGDCRWQPQALSATLACGVRTTQDHSFVAAQHFCNLFHIL
jgi:hypothetical protein